ncbi:protein Wnt-16-like isoform X2 [Orbicella faveolata]|uniref:protein Wnt-16-like isoform X2 n=1 Tax=Orbicella faveolata TaxID=48498 RepID=UPI0009E3AD53|nr:protein Wnt-16-like isoform X2 [Orbicella faveolata]
MAKKKCLVLYALLLGVFQDRTTASWMWMGISALGTRSDGNLTTCYGVPGLSSQQMSVCQSKPDLIPTLRRGANLGITECQKQFEKERWNCSTTNSSSVFGEIIDIGSPEAAFVYAITSAGVVHAASRSCSLGNLSDCACEARRKRKQPSRGWEWGGCNDDVKFGVWLSKTFVDAPERNERSGTIADRKMRVRKKGRYLMNLHNNEVGRLVVQSLVSNQCRCHGVSGSCTIKTCWKTVPNFAKIGDHLKVKYKKAVQVVYNRKKRRIRRKEQKRVKITKDTLVFIDRPPNYCNRNPALGILGTSGRVCNKTSPGSDRCDLLCCGAGYNTQVVREVKRCQCKFVWCCYVTCKECPRIYDRHTCK